VEEAFTVIGGPYAGAKVVRYRTLDYPDHQIGFAHMNTIETPVGNTGPTGTVIGHAGSSGGVACHLHMGDKPTWLKGQPIDEIDWWPLLIQNGATEDEVLQGANPVAVSNKRGSILGANTRFRSSPFVRDDNILTELAPPATIDPDYIVDGTLALGTNKWYGAWASVGTGKSFGYVNVNAVGALKPIEQSGYTAKDLVDATAKGAHTAAADVSGAAGAAAAKYP
jgi:hypothetical protein